MMRQFELVDKVSGYLSNLDENLLNLNKQTAIAAPKTS